VLQVAARVVSRHSLNVMAGHDDVYASCSRATRSLFGSNRRRRRPRGHLLQGECDVAHPGRERHGRFATSHMMSEVLMPEPALLKEFLGDPEGRIKAPTVAQEILFGAKGRAFS